MAMDAISVIRTKRDRGELSDEQIDWVIDAYTRGEVADEQMSALAMAILLNGMDRLLERRAARRPAGLGLGHRGGPGVAGRRGGCRLGSGAHTSRRGDRRAGRHVLGRRR